MFRNELSLFLLRVLDAVERLPGGIMVDSRDEPDPIHVARIAEELGESDDDIRGALIGLRACECLTQQPLEIPGVESLYMWRVHPQCLSAGAAKLDPD